MNCDINDNQGMLPIEPDSDPIIFTGAGARTEVVNFSNHINISDGVLNIPAGVVNFYDITGMVHLVETGVVNSSSANNPNIIIEDIGATGINTYVSNAYSNVSFRK